MLRRMRSRFGTSDTRGASVIHRGLPFFLVVAVIYLSFGGPDVQRQPGGFFGAAFQPSANQEAPRIITTFNVVHEDEAEKTKKQ